MNRIDELLRRIDAELAQEPLAPLNTAPLFPSIPVVGSLSLLMVPDRRVRDSGSGSVQLYPDAVREPLVPPKKALMFTAPTLHPTRNHPTDYIRLPDLRLPFPGPCPPPAVQKRSWFSRLLFWRSR